jgi:hypothetical protein
MEELTPHGHPDRTQRLECVALSVPSFERENDFPPCHVHPPLNVRCVMR